MRIIKAIIISMVAILALNTTATGTQLSVINSTILYVKQEGNGDCLDWTSACELQSALSIAEIGDQVWVAAGIYKPTTDSDREVSFELPSGVAIYGGFPVEGGAWEDRDWETHITTLSGDIGILDDNTDNSYHVVIGDSLDETTILDGFIISSGNANLNGSHDDGGGMYLTNSNLYLSNLTFTDNRVNTHGGGIYNFQGSPILTNVTFSNNSAGWGGGMYNYLSNPKLINVAFIGNSGAMGGEWQIFKVTPL